MKDRFLLIVIPEAGAGFFAGLLYVLGSLLLVLLLAGACLVFVGLMLMYYIIEVAALALLSFLLFKIGDVNSEKLYGVQIFLFGAAMSFFNLKVYHYLDPSFTVLVVILSVVFSFLFAWLAVSSGHGLADKNMSGVAKGFIVFFVLLLIALAVAIIVINSMGCLTINDMSLTQIIALAFRCAGQSRARVETAV